MPATRELNQVSSCTRWRPGMGINRPSGCPRSGARHHSYWRAAVRTLLLTTCVLAANLAVAADPDAPRADQLIRDGKYQEAYELLAPFESTNSNDATYTYLLGRAALGTQRGEEAKALFERS